jgi:hypothetical protein
MEHEYPRYTLIKKEDREFLDYVKAHRDLGYGRMMQIISHEWYRQAQRDRPSMEGGAFVANTCFAFLSEKEQRAFLQVLEMEEKHGMEY